MKVLKGEDEEMRESRLEREALEAKSNQEVASDTRANMQSTFAGQWPTSAEVTGTAVIPGASDTTLPRG